MTRIVCDRCPKCGKFFEKYIPDKLKDSIEQEKVCPFCGKKLTVKDIKIYF